MSDRSMSRRLLRAWRVAGALAIAVVLSGHVGTNDVSFVGAAGPWHVRVSIRQPGVIPGLAYISVRVAEPGVERVTVTARQTRAGGGQAPPPDVAAPVRGETGLFAAQLWLMNRGAHEVVVTVDGNAGHGRTAIPVVAVANKQLEMTRGLEIFVLGGGLFLIAGLLTIVGTAARESVLPAGQQPAPSDRRRAWGATAVAALVLAAALFGGWNWVRAESAAHRANLDRPWSSEATLRADGGRRTLELAITEPLWVNRRNAARTGPTNRNGPAELVPDHGKMMHMFLIREGDMDAFAHIHPVRLDNAHFAVAFPPLPEGRYRVYADIAHEDGLSHTLSASVEAGPPAEVELSTPDTTLAPDPDDAWWIDAAADGDRRTAGPGVAPAATSAARESSVSPLADGSVMRWLNAGEPLVAGADAELVFRVEDADGNAIAVDPYMGMRGHAMLNRSDGAVFVHLHPSGMISMAAQSALSSAAGAASGMAPGMNMGGSEARAAGGDEAIAFPLVVPDAGLYRVWVQVRRGDEVVTGFFDAEVRTR